MKFFKYFIVQSVDSLLQGKLGFFSTINALGNVLRSSEQCVWLVFTDDLGMDTGQWRCSSQLLHLSALILPSPNFIHPNQQQHHYPRKSFISSKVYRGLSACTARDGTELEFHHLSVNSSLTQTVVL